MICLELPGYFEHAPHPVKKNVTGLLECVSNEIEFRGNMHVKTVNPQSSLVIQPIQSPGSIAHSEKSLESEDFDGFMRSGEETHDTLGNTGQRGRADELLDLAERPLSRASNDAEPELEATDNSGSAEAREETELRGSEEGQTLTATLNEGSTNFGQSTQAQLRTGNQLPTDSQPTALVTLATGFGEKGSVVASSDSNDESQALTAKTRENRAGPPPEHSREVSILGEHNPKVPAKMPVPTEIHRQEILSRMELFNTGNSDTRSIAASKGSIPAPALSENLPEPRQVIAQMEMIRSQSNQQDPARAPDSRVGLVEEIEASNKSTVIHVNTSSTSGTEKSPLSGHDFSKLENLRSFSKSFEVPQPRADVSIGSATQSAPEPATLRPEVVQNAASRAVEVFVRQPGRLVEVALKPEELGRIRLALSTSEAGVTVVITSERPETLDLMRRHIDQLAEEFAKLGYQNMDFQFGKESSGDETHSRNAGSDLRPGLAERNESDIGHSPLLVSTGLDLRL